MGHWDLKPGFPVSLRPFWAERSENEKMAEKKLTLEKMTNGGLTYSLQRSATPGIDSAQDFGSGARPGCPSGIPSRTRDAIFRGRVVTYRFSKITINTEF